MGSKRNKKAKQELELALEKNDNNKNEPQCENFNVENNGAVVRKSEKRKKRKCDSEEVVAKKKRKTNPKPPGERKPRERKRKSKVGECVNNLENIVHNNAQALPNHNVGIKIENTNNTTDKKKDDITWAEKDITELINRMEYNIPESDTLAFNTRAEKLNWSNVTFKNYSPEECKKTWLLIQKKLRRFRLLREVLNDAREWINNPKLTFKPVKTKKKHPDMPRRPLSSYLLFYLKKKGEIISENPGLEGSDITKLIGQKYKELPPDKREKYEKQAAINKEEYLRQLKIFYENHPELVPPPKISQKIEKEKLTKLAKLEKIKPQKPHKAEKVKPRKRDKEKPPKKCQTAFGLYFAAELKNALPNTDKSAFKEKCKELWKEMTDKKKMYWINMAEQSLIKYEEDVRNYKAKHPEFEVNPVKSILTKEEKVLKERVAGKPIKPPNSAYGLFSKIMLQSGEIKVVNPKERMNYIANKWKACSEEEKNSFKDQTNILMEKYKLDWNSYLDSLPEEQREFATQTQVKKKPPTVSLKPKSKKPRKRRERKDTKIQKNKVTFKEPEQPPISACKYFATIYKGDDPTQAWKNLNVQEKRKYEDELTLKKQAYIVEFEKFLKSLSKEELEAFSKSRQQAKSDDDDDESSDCSSDSEDGNDDADEVEEEDNDDDNIEEKENNPCETDTE